MLLGRISDIGSSYCLNFSKNVACFVRFAHNSPRPVKDVKESVQKSLHVAVIGVPNAGKSTFINSIVNHRVCPTSSKVHTTRDANAAICTIKNTQLVFVDTPGLVTPKEIKKHNLEHSFRKAYRKAIHNADVIAVLHDVSNQWTRNQLHSTVIDTLNEFKSLPSFLVLNKIDALKSKRILLDLIKKLTNGKLSSTKYNTAPSEIRSKKASECENKNQEQGSTNTSTDKNIGKWEEFEDIFLVSSLTSDGIDAMQEYLKRNAEHRPWRYLSTDFTDETPENLIVASVRARLLDYLPQEIPYNLKTELEYYSEEKALIHASVQITSPTARVERLVCGESNGKLRQITERITSDLVETFRKPISLTITTTSKVRNEN